jgi:hypothetical protein
MNPAPYPLPADSVREPVDPAEVANYISEMTDELAKLAAGAGLETVCYLLTLARLECEAGREDPDAGA